MSIYIFISSGRPQYYFSDHRNILNYFVSHFFFSRKPALQIPISIIKHVLPYLISLFVRNSLRIEPSLPDELSETVKTITRYINESGIRFLPEHISTENIGFLIRTSKWARADNKFVVIFFNNSNAQPFTVVKVGPLSSKRVIEKEFHNAMSVYNNLNGKTPVAIPEPVTVWDSGSFIAYFERVIYGIPFSDYLKLILRKKKRHRIFIEVIRICTVFLSNLSSSDKQLNAEDFKRYFHDPINSFLTKCNEDKDRIKLSILKEQVANLEINSLNSVLMHGDFWNGNLIYNNGEIGVIDWEMYTDSGVPLWDLFSLIFHIGTDSDYFTDDAIAEKLNAYFISLSGRANIDENFIPVLFQCYLLFNVQNRDTDTEKYWHSLLQYYWSRSAFGATEDGRLL